MADADWPGEGRRNPGRSSASYAILAPLTAWLRAEADAAARRHPGGYRLLDVGCGVKPYYPLFASGATEYVGVDVDGPAADLRAPGERLPVRDATFDVVLCTQVLEHCDDPAQVVRELRRVVAPGGRVLASTHGVQLYHPAPSDLWRWTHAGLERLFDDNGDWSSLIVAPGSGTTACLAMLVSRYVELLAGRAHVRGLSRPIVAALNTGAERIDRTSRRLREPGPGTLFANYHVTATA